jgi:hypothetical protein
VIFVGGDWPHAQADDQLALWSREIPLGFETTPSHTRL